LQGPFVEEMRKPSADEQKKMRMSVGAKTIVEDSGLQQKVLTSQFLAVTSCKQHTDGRWSKKWLRYKSTP